MAHAGSPHSKAGRALLPPDPPQVLMNPGIGPQQFNGVKLPRQRSLGEHGMKLAMAGGTKFGLRPMVAAAGSWNQVMYRVPGGLTEAQLALVWFRLAGPGSLRSFSGCFPFHPDWFWVSGSKKRQPGRSTRHWFSSKSMGITSPDIMRRSGTVLASSVTPKGRKAKA